MDQRRPDDHDLKPRIGRHQEKRALGLQLAHTIGICRIWGGVRPKRHTRLGFLAIDLDRTQIDETADTGRSSLARKPLRTGHIDATEFRQRIKGALVHYVHPRRQMDHRVAAAQNRHPVRFGIDRIDTTPTHLLRECIRRHIATRNGDYAAAIVQQAPNQGGTDKTCCPSNQN